MVVRKRRALPVYPMPSDVHRILAVCDNDRDRILIELLWHTGGRVSEVIQIRAGDITKAGVRMRNLKQSVPTEKHVFLSPVFLTRLRSYVAGMAKGATIVGRLADGHQLTRERAWQIVTKTGKRAGVFKQRFNDGDLRAPWPHSFRHGNAVHLLENGVSISAVQGQLGHSSLASTQVYTQLTDPHRQAMIAGVTF